MQPKQHQDLGCWQLIAVCVSILKSVMNNVGCQQYTSLTSVHVQHRAQLAAQHPPPYLADHPFGSTLGTQLGGCCSSFKSLTSRHNNKQQVV